MGPDSYVNAILRCYVEQLSSKPQDWKNHLKFYIVPLSTAAAGATNGIGSGTIYSLVTFEIEFRSIGMS